MCSPFSTCDTPLGFRRPRDFKNHQSRTEKVVVYKRAPGTKVPTELTVLVFVFVTLQLCSFSGFFTRYFFRFVWGGGGAEADLRGYGSWWRVSIESGVRAGAGGVGGMLSAREGLDNAL